jgi:pyruvate formate lyase activating enzyme
MDRDRKPHRGRWWSRHDGRFRCELCPRFCILSPGQRGFCFVREADTDGIVLTSYGRSSGFCIDPVEKKPLYHFHPGSAVLSFGTAGCNLGCRYCQNWDLTKAAEIDRLGERASPVAIAQTARRLGCTSVAFTYNDPVIFAEYAIDTARACREARVHSIAVTAGYVTAGARGELFAAMDAANIDLKAFSEEFYHRQCYGHLAPVLETIEYAVKETSCWVELTNLVIPGLNDSDAEIEALCAWVLERLGPHVPLHFTAFHPDYKLLDLPPTPPETLRRARARAKSLGIDHVYTGNIADVEGASTTCAGCEELVVERRGYEVTRFRLDEGFCPVCRVEVPGHFGVAPGQWGARRLAVLVEEPEIAGEHESG